MAQPPSPMPSAKRSASAEIFFMTKNPRFVSKRNEDLGVPSVDCD
jgi:hypothetical protein